RLPFKPTAGVAVTFRVTIQDRYSNVINMPPYFMDTVKFTSSDPKAVLPSNYTFTAPNTGIQDFMATLYTAGTQSITVQDIANPAIISASIPDILLQPAATSQLVVSGFPAHVTAGVSYPFTITAQDPYDNITPSYQGTVMFGSSDGAARLPASYTFTSADAGVHNNFMATWNTAGAQSISATDTLDAGITGSESVMVFQMQPTITVSGPFTDSSGQFVAVPGQPLNIQLE